MNEVKARGDTAYGMQEYMEKVYNFAGVSPASLKRHFGSIFAKSAKMLSMKSCYNPVFNI
jgi:hypothetical protein